MATAREVAEKMRKKTQNNEEEKASITAREAAERLRGNQSTSFNNSNKTPTFDYETGKKGWQKYLDDQSNAEQKKAEEKEDEKWWETLGRYLGSTGATDTTLPLGNTGQIINDVRNDTSYQRPGDDWTEDQQYEFGALYLESPGKAYSYAEKINNENNKAKEAAEIEKIQNSATSSDWGKIGHTAGAIASAGLSWADYLNMLVLSNAGRDPLASDGIVSPFEYSTAVTEGISTDLNNAYGTLDENIPIIGGKGWGDVYGLGTSIAQSAATGYLLGPAGTLVSYVGQGAASGMKDALERGVGDWQAAVYGLALGTFEGVAEMIGIDNLFKIGSSSTIKGLLKNILKQAGAEGMEEGLTSIFSNIADNALKDKSNFYAMVSQYMALGMSEEEAKKKAWLDSIEGILFDTLAGAVSGGVHGGASTTIQTGISNYNTNKYFGNQAQDIVNDALNSPHSDVQAIGQKYQNQLDSGKKLSGWNLNELIELTDTDKIKNAVLQRLGELGETSDVTAVAEVLVKQALGEELSSRDQNILNKSKYGNVVATELSEDNIKSGGLANNWAAEIGTRKASPEVYNKTKIDATKELVNNTATKVSKYKVSEDGKTTLNDQEVSIQGVESIKGGEVTVRLESGETVNASDLKFSDKEVLMYDVIARMEATPDTANQILSQFKPTSTAQASMYYNSIPLAYEYGKINYEAGLKNINMPKHLKNSVFTRGRIDAMIQAESKTPKTNSAQKGSNKTKSGIIYESGFTYDEASSNEMQKVSMAHIEVINKMSNLEVHVYESYVNEDGKRVYLVDGKEQPAPHGYFKDGNKIYIDFNAGDNGEGAMLYTMSHEVTHYIREWNAEGFKELGDFLIEQYGKNGVSVEELLEKQRDKIRKRYARENKPLPSEAKLNDMAYEEMVCDAMSDMLADPKAYEKLAKLKQQNKTLWEKVGEAIKAVLDKLKAALGIYKGKDVATEAARVRDFSSDVYDKLQDLYIKAFVQADANYEESDLVSIDAASESVSPMFSERTWTESEYVVLREQAAKKISKALGVTEAKALKYIDDINSIAKMIANDRARLDYEASSFGSAFVSNVEYGGSFDYTTLCKKRRIYTGTFTEIQKRLKDVALTPDDILKIRNMLIEEGVEATCGLCYVEGSRANMGKFAKEFIKLYKRDNPLAWVPNMADVNTPDGVEQMRISHPEAYEQYVHFWNHYGKLKESDPALFASQQKPKLYEARKEYKGEILEHFKGDSTVAKKNRNGGIRMQSFSDFEIVHLIDTMQVIMDMSTVGLAGQAYTKVPEFAKAFGDTGLKINLSLIAKGVDANGNLIFDDREGMPHETAFDLRNRHSKNVGTIIVTFTDEQLLAAMADPRIDFIIPFHRSQWKKGQYGAMGLPKGTKDYTYMQNEKFIKQTYHEYRGRMVKDKASNYMPNEYWDFSKSGKENAEAYLKMCSENNKRPKFYKLLNYDGKGTYSLKADGSTDGYWKLLIDFKMYDNDGVGSPQNAVTPTFNMDEARTMLDEYQGGHSKYPVASGVVDKFVNQYEGKSETKFSDRDSSKDNYILYSDRNPREVTESDVRNILDNIESYDKDSYFPVRINTPRALIEAARKRGDIIENLPVVMQVKKAQQAMSDEAPRSSIERSHGLSSDDMIAILRAMDEPTYIVYQENGRYAEIVRFVTEAKKRAIAILEIGENKNAIHMNGYEGGIYQVLVTAFVPDNYQYIKDILDNKKNTILPIEKKKGSSQRSSGSQVPSLLNESPFFENSIPQNTDSVNREFSDFEEMHSDRDTETTSNRTLLANALETTAKTDKEKEKLKQYKTKIALIESEQARLTKIRAEIKKLSFAKGPKDTARIESLQETAAQIESQINKYDRQLLNLESTTALKDVLQREKQMAYKKAQKEGREALQRQKEKDAETVRTLLTQHRESRQRATESRNKTAMKAKIKKVVHDLNKLLLNPTQDKHVPIGLQKVVAEALDAINMDSMNAEERVAYYNDLISKSSDPDEIAMLTKKRDFFEYRDMNFKERITELKNAYAEFKESDDPLIRNAHNDAIADLIKNTADEVGNKSLKDMSLSQLERVYDMYKAILATVRNANKMFKEGRQETVTENSDAVKLEVRSVGGHKDRVLKMTKFLKKFGWDMLKPVTAMKVIGSTTFERLFNNVRAAEDTWAVDVNEAKQFFDDIAAKYGYNKWDLKKYYTFKDSAGTNISITLEQIMSLYAYSKRNQADKHLEDGGFVFDDAIEVIEKNKLGIPLKYEVNDANPYRLRKEHLLEITDALTKEQKDFVDAMQTYLSDVMGAKGNEVSLAMYDIKLYKEQNYFPLKTSRYFREFDPEKSATPKIKNSGFSKKTVPQAGNPIVLSNFMDVWAGHVNDMSMYHAFVLPLEDFMRVYNYSSTTGGYDSVQQYIKNAYGAQANQYIEKLMNDLNGGARVDSSAGIINKGLSLFKKASVFASASVVVQQPSAIARALAYINPKYFVKATPEALNIAKHKALWAEVKKYAPVAVIKEMGYFDTGVGRSTVEWIKGNQTFKDKMDGVLSKAPALADELCWVHIWEAVKKENAAKSKSKVGSEIFLMECGKRFTEVITNTQVYDSVLSRSGMMRSKDTGMKMATAFMAEPTTTVNMMVDGIIQGMRGNKKFTAATVGAVSASIILNSILVSLVYAARDDDEDETYLEKYIGSLTTELLDGFNPLTYIPFVKDIWSIAQGYDVERSDMSVISKLWESIESLFNEDKSGLDKVLEVTGSIASLFGIPLKNIIRDAKGMYSLTKTILSGVPTTEAGIGYAVEDAFKSSIPLWDRLHESDSKTDKLYDAIMSGDQNQINRVKATYKSEQKLETALKTALRENDSRIKRAAQARLDGNILEYARIAKEIIAEGHFSQDTVVGAINAEISAIKKAQLDPTESTDDKDEVTSIYKADDINVAFNNGDKALALSIIDDLVKTKVANGMDETKAKSSLRSSMTSYWKPLYLEAAKSGNKAEMQRIKQILFYSGLYGSAADVVKAVKGWTK